MESLAILGEIIDRLGPLGGVERGTPLRSDDWNVMVDALTSVAKLAVSREETLNEAVWNRATRPPDTITAARPS